MGIIFANKHMSKCFLLGLYCCFSFLFFCAFYQYTTTHYGLSIPFSTFSEWKPQELKPPETRMVHPNRTISKRPDTIVRELLGRLHANESSALEAAASASKMQQPVSDEEAVAGQTSSVQPTLLVPSAQETALEARSGRCPSSESKPKLILLWTSFFENWDYMPRGPFTHCPSCRNCLVTRNRSRLLESDAVIFHARDLFLADLPLQRLPQQRWVYYCLESPPYSDFAGLQFMHRMFNWTMTYRADSDIVTQYGVVEKVHPRRKLDKNALRDIWERKTKSVVWMSSHCPTHGGRDDFVYQLQKYIDVDEYGSCGTMKCPKDATKKCLTDFAENYKFFLAFENSICNDYITEKFYRTLKYDIVPVVFGGAQYQRFAPPGSYIDALQFKSPKHLAYFLAGVGKDFALYSSYFEWRTEYSVRMENFKECSLCNLLHNNHTKPSVYEDMREWWVGEGQCRTWQPKG